MNEHELLLAIYAISTPSQQISIGPGDDMGELTIGKERVLCAVDQLVVGRHVQPETPPELIGRKAIARCFSDIAAMAATPIGALMTACIPLNTSNTWCETLFASAQEVAQQWGGPIFGGDIASSEGPAVFTVTAIATPGTRAITRTGAHVGDYICVTGELGNSIVDHHLSFTPRIKEAHELVNSLGGHLHSMIDISDGLGQDASHLATDQLQLVIDTALLPLRKEATIDSAISDGEDYELLFTSAVKPPANLAKVIGKVELGTRKVITTSGTVISDCGWNHQ